MKKLVWVIILIIVALMSFSACDMSQSVQKMEVTVSDDGYVVVNGIKTAYKVETEDIIEVDDDGYLVVNGVKTEYAVSQCNHIWTTVTTAPTCTESGYDTMTCSLCGNSVILNETAPTPHTYSECYTTDDTHHWYKCTGCDSAEGKAEHILSDNGNCATCGIPVSATFGVIYDVSADGMYAEVIGYEGTAAKVKIDEEYNDLPVKNIYKEAFKSNKTIELVVIPDSVTSIGSSAFYQCSNLSSVAIPESVTSIGTHAFVGCSSLELNEYGNCKYLGSRDNSYFALIQTTSDNYSSYEIHSDTKVIADRTFAYHSLLTFIVIPESVTSIGAAAFQYCLSLTSIVIPDSVTSIREQTFDNCSSLSSIVLGDNMTSIGDWAFTRCPINSIVIPNSVMSIGSNAFYECTSLTSVVIGDGVTSIGDAAFVGCSSLNSVIIGDSVTSIGEWAFASCTSLISVALGDSVTSIDDWAFNNCSSLTYVVIDNSVTSIGNYAFASCAILADVYYTGSEEEWGKISIGNNHSYLRNATIHYNYVPEN